MVRAAQTLPTLVALGLFAIAPVAAQEGPVKPRSFSGDLGFVNVSGNTSVTTLNVGDKFTAMSHDGRAAFTQTAGVVYGKTNGTKSAQSYTAQLRGDYGLGGKLYLFGLAGWERNTFAGVARRFEETMGLGFKAITEPNDHLEFEAGLSLFQQKNTFAHSGESLDDNYKAGRVAGAYKHVFTKSSFFTQSVEFLPNFDTSEQWRLNSESAFIAPVSTHIAFKAGYVVKYDHLPPFLSATSNVRLKTSDRLLTMGITMSY
jgi:putative salt-induced outer membrane protein